MRTVDPTPEHEPPGLLRAMWQHRVLTFLVIALFTGLGIAAGLATDPGKTAGTKVGLSDPRIALGQTLPNSDVQTRYVYDQADFAGSDGVLAAAAKELDLPLSTLRSRVTVLGSDGVNSFTVEADAPTIQAARDQVDAVVSAYRQASAARLQAESASRLTAIQEAQAELRRALAAEEDATTAGSQALQSLIDDEVAVRVRARTVGDGVLFSDPAREIAPGLLSRPEVRNGLAGLTIGVIVASVLALARTDRPSPAAGQSGRGRPAPAAEHEHVDDLDGFWDEDRLDAGPTPEAAAVAQRRRPAPPQSRRDGEPVAAPVEAAPVAASVEAAPVEVEDAPLEPTPVQAVPVDPTPVAAAPVESDAAPEPPAAPPAPVEREAAAPAAAPVAWGTTESLDPFPPHTGYPATTYHSADPAPAADADAPPAGTPHDDSAVPPAPVEESPYRDVPSSTSLWSTAPRETLSSSPLPEDRPGLGVDEPGRH